MPPATELRPPPLPDAGAPRPDRAAMRRVYLRRRLAVGAVGLLAVLGGVAACEVVTGAGASEGPGADRATATRPTTTVPTTTASTTTTTLPTTTAPPTTVPATTVPPAPPVPAVNAGPLDPGTGAVPVFHRIPTTDPVVFLTIDDGGHRDPWAPEVLSVRGAMATPFLTQAYVDGGEDYFRRFQATGATIEAHSITHALLEGLPEDVQRGEVCGPVDAYAQRFGARPTLFRPPYGEYDDATLRAAASCGVRAVAHWNVVVEDGQISRSGGGPLQPGDVVLLHFTPRLPGDLTLVLDLMGMLGLRAGNLAQYVDAALAVTPPPAPAPPAPPAPAPTA